MASAACSSPLVASNASPSPSSSSRQHPVASISTAPAAYRLRSAISSPKPLPVGWSCKGGTAGASRRDLPRIKATAKKYRGTVTKEKRLAELIEQKVLEAKEVCQQDQSSDGCRVAWDEVEEVSRAKADFRRRLAVRDPLESFCRQNPARDECCVVYDE